MFIIEAIPAVNIPREYPQILTYFSNEPLSRGSVVLVSLRNRSVPALILSSNNIDTEKIELKNMSFTIKKIDGITSKCPIFSDADFTFFKWFADYYFLPLGLALKTILPEKILKAKRPIKELADFKSFDVPQTDKKTPILCTLNKQERYDVYCKEIASAIKQKKQSIILFPDYINASLFNDYIAKHIDKNQILFFTTDLTPRQYFDIWLKIATGEALVAIGTRSAVFLKFYDLGFIAVDEEEDQNFKSWDARPYYNSRECALKLADIHNAKIILSSATPSIESYFHAKQNEYQTIKPDTEHNFTNSLIVDMRDELKKDNYIISEDLESSLQKIEQEGGQAVIFINRRGHGTFIFCQECSFTIKCQNCDAPMVFHKEIKSANQQLVCHYCNTFRKAPDVCPKCGGLKIKYSGIASQKAEESINNAFPDLKIKRIDAETILSSRDLKSALQDFQSGKINILLGTQMMLNKIPIKADLVAILSIDTILNLPEFRTDERMYQIVNQMKDFRRDDKTPVILQTFKPDQEIFKKSLRSDFESLYDGEIDTRRALGYPPFMQLIKLTHKHIDPKLAHSQSQKIAELIEKQCDNIIKSTNNEKSCAMLGPNTGFIPRIKSKYIYNIILKTNFSIKERNQVLSIVPSKDWYIDVDPVSLI